MGLASKLTYSDGYEFAADYVVSQQPIEQWFETIDDAKHIALETGHPFFAGIADRILHMILPAVIYIPEQEKSRP